MSQQSSIVLPYLFFGGNCREAMEFYKTIFGGELTLNTYGDGPADAHADAKANSPEMKNRIMHARLNGDVVLLGSDSPYLTETNSSGSFNLCLEGSDEATLGNYFDRLSEGGKVAVPLMKQFWGDVFGMLTDQFGIGWMVSIKG